MRGGQRTAGGVAWLGLAVLLLAPAGAAVRVGRANGLCVRASLLAGGFVLRGELLPLQASLTTAPGRLVFDQAGGLDAHTRETLRQVEQALARVPVPGLAAAFTQHGVEVIAEDAGATLEGGSAGLAIFAAAASALLGVPLRGDVALTGVLTAEGEVRPVGGLGYKVDAVVRERVRVLVVPAENAGELLGATPDLPRRCRVVGVGAVHPALVEAFGDAGPFAAERRAYAERFDEALRLYRLGRSGAARTALSDCRRLLPDDLTARLWLAQAGTPDEPDAVLEQLAEVDRLAREGQWQAAAELAGEARAVVVDPARIDWLLADLAAQWSRAETERAVRPVREALEQGDLVAAQGWLDGAAVSALDGDARHSLALLQRDVEYRRQREAAGERPGDRQAWERVADAAEAAEEWEAAAEALRRVRGLAPVEPDAVRREARAELRSGRPETARTLLLAQLLERPGADESRAVLALLGCDSVAPSISCGVEAGTVWHGTARLQAASDEPAATVVILLDGSEVARGRGAVQQTLSLAGRVAGGHLLSAVALDPAGNLAETSLPVVVAPAPPVPADHGLPMAAGGGTVHVVAAGTWLVGPSDQVVIHPAAVWSAALVAAQAGPEALRVSLPPLLAAARPATEPLALPSVPWQGRVAELRLCGQLADGRCVAPAELKLVRTDRLTARLLSPAEGALLRAPAAVELEVDGAFRAVLARVLCDGREVLRGSPGGLRLEPAALGQGRHRVAVVLTGSDGRSCQTAEVGVTVP